LNQKPKQIVNELPSCCETLPSPSIT